MDRASNETHLKRLLVFLAAFVFCGLIGFLLHDPIPRVHDEFSYLLMSDTFAHGHVSNKSPSLPEFFETFHVLVSPAHVSKYFPIQGIFLALGAKLSGHPSIGVWLSSALACAATTWMLESWVGIGWALLGGCLMAFQYGIFSYWSQSYWGGMGAALGGALFFGAMRRLWDRFSWQNAFWLSVGLLIMANSRPLESLLAALPISALFLYSLWRKRRWRESGFGLQFALPVAMLLSCGAVATGAYNHAITGSAFESPYMVHEAQYQESQPLIFLPQRPSIPYSNVQLQNYYERLELRAYQNQRHVGFWLRAAGRKIATWWQFYCGTLLSIPLFLPALFREGKVRIAQLVAIFGLLSLILIPSGYPNAWRFVVDVLGPVEIWVLWSTFDDRWSRLAVTTCTLVMTVLLFAKWSFPHYFAPAASLVLYLQVAGLKRLWEWNPEAEASVRKVSRSERRRKAREGKTGFDLVPWVRRVVYFVPVACFFSLVLRVEGRINGWKEDPHGVLRGALPMNDWSLRRADLEHWLEQQPTPQLVFVRYSPYHNVNFEWVYNQGDIMHSHVIWARDLGADHNELLLKLVPDRTVWLLEPDTRDSQLVPYTTTPAAEPQSSPRTGTSTDDEQGN